MPVGLSVQNASGFILIDSDYSNLALVASGTVTTDTVADNFSSKFVSVGGLTGGRPVAVVAHTAGAFGNVRSYASNTAGVDIVVRAPVGATVKYWLFGPPVIAAHGAGLRVYNAAGAAVFDAQQKYLRVVGTISGTADGGSTPNVTLPTGRTYAIMQQSPAAYANRINLGNVVNPNWLLVDMRACFAVNANVVSKVRDEINQQNWGTTAPPSYNVSATGVIVDVTGY